MTEIGPSALVLGGAMRRIHVDESTLACHVCAHEFRSTSDTWKGLVCPECRSDGSLYRMGEKKRAY